MCSMVEVAASKFIGAHKEELPLMNTISITLAFSYWYDEFGHDYDSVDHNEVLDRVMESRDL